MFFIPIPSAIHQWRLRQRPIYRTTFQIARESQTLPKVRASDLVANRWPGNLEKRKVAGANKSGTITGAPIRMHVSSCLQIV